jgi:hypothetical protein
VATLLCGGGPRTQANFDGSWEGFFGVEVVADLLILSREGQQSQEGVIEINSENMYREELNGMGTQANMAQRWMA